MRDEQIAIFARREPSAGAGSCAILRFSAGSASMGSVEELKHWSAPSLAAEAEGKDAHARVSARGRRVLGIRCRISRFCILLFYSI